MSEQTPQESEPVYDKFGQPMIDHIVYDSDSVTFAKKFEQVPGHPQRGVVMEEWTTPNYQMPDGSIEPTMRMYKMAAGIKNGEPQIMIVPGWAVKESADRQLSVTSPIGSQAPQKEREPFWDEGSNAMSQKQFEALRSRETLKEKAEEDLGEDAVESTPVKITLVGNKEDAVSAARRIVETTPSDLEDVVKQVSDGGHEYDDILKQGTGSDVNVENAAQRAGMNDETAAEVQGYYDDAKEEQKRAQQEGRGDDAQYWGQVAGQHAEDLRKHGRTTRY